jgi:hypothetical protein
MSRAERKAMVAREHHKTRMLAGRGPSPRVPLSDPSVMAGAATF